MGKIDKQAYLQKIDDVIKKGKYKDDWNSMKNIKVPEWYTKNKFGIFTHWGVYSVPAFGSEWYPKTMYEEGSREFEHHVKTYGEHKNFGYKDFVPMFKAEKFDADEWLELFERAGAKFYTVVAEHHDGFQMYKSDISEWNSFDMGPKRDVLGELKAAGEKRGIRVGVTHHRIEHWWFMQGGKKFDSDMSQNLDESDLYWPSMPETGWNSRYPTTFMTPEYKDLSVKFAEDWIVRCCELIDNYKPASIFFDWWIQVEPLKPYLKKFAAYYYNRMEEWGVPGMIQYKFDSMAFGTGVLDVERGQFGDLKPFPWQSDTSIARNSWCYTKNNDFKTSSEILMDLIDVVSKNGCMLLNVGPKADGTIIDEEVKVLHEIGDWLKVNGEAVYDTVHFKIFGEGPTQVFTREGDFTDAKSKGFTSEDIRFTQNGENLYATVLVYPENGEVSIKSLGRKANIFYGFIKDISVLGFDEKPEFELTDEKLVIRTKSVKSGKPAVFKIIID